MCSRSTTRVGFYITCVDEPQEQNMEFVPLSDVALRHLALDDPILKRVFHGVHPSDWLPSRPTRTTRAAYIVNTDPRGEPGKHWEHVKSWTVTAYLSPPIRRQVCTTGWCDGPRYGTTIGPYKP